MRNAEILVVRDELRVGQLPVARLQASVSAHGRASENREQRPALWVRRMCAVLALSLTFLFPVPAVAGHAHWYVQPLTTTQCCYALNTNAWWDADECDPELGPFIVDLKGGYDTSDGALGVAVSGRRAYVADGLSGLHVIDVSDPMAPTLLGSYDTPGYAEGVAVAGSYAYVADGVSGLQIVDVSDPTSPTLAGNHDTPDFAYGVAVSGSYAYIASGASGLQIVDVSDPTMPTLAGSYESRSTVWDVAVDGQHAYVAGGIGGLLILDISDPTSPYEAASYETRTMALGVTVSRDHAYVAGGASGLQLIDVSNPASPVLAGRNNTPTFAYGLTVSNDLAYVAGGASGLQVMLVCTRAWADTLPPDPPQGLEGECVDGARLRLHWSPNTESDLSHYSVHRGAQPDFVPDETNRVGTTAEASFADNEYHQNSEWYYKVSAWDVHENESGCALLEPDDIRASLTFHRTYDDLLSQNAPNPFVSTTRIAFSMKNEGPVRLEVFDVVGRLVRVIADDVRLPNSYVEEWDGRDYNGRSVPAGTYFYRLEAPGWSAVKKMMVAR